MTEERSALREQLREEAPQLYESLMRSWEIAKQQWLPAISAKGGSFNSFPHLRNIEQYANDLIAQATALTPGSDDVRFSPVEKYLLLAAILFHDIGRSRPEKDHAKASWSVIRTDFPSLGIDSKPIAYILADICCFHSCDEDMKARLDLGNHHVSPYGIINTMNLAVILKTVDEMDGAYTRVFPHYLICNPRSTVQEMRNSTPSVRVDLRNGIVVNTTEFSDLDPFREDPQQAFSMENGRNGKKWMEWSSIQYKMNDDFPSVFGLLEVPHSEIISFRSSLRLPNNSLPSSNGVEEKPERPCEICGRYSDCELSSHSQTIHQIIDSSAIQKGGQPANLPKLFSCVENPKGFINLPCPSAHLERSRLLPHLLLRGFLQVARWPAGELLDLSPIAFLASAANVRASAAKLVGIRLDLAVSGFPIEAWVLEYREHLFTCAGRETYEASLSREFLCEVVRRMWQLSAGMFGREPCTYETLAAKLRTNDLPLVRTAVRRLAIVTRHRAQDGRSGSRQDQLATCHTFRAAVDRWWWIPQEGSLCGKNRPTANGAPNWHSMQQVLERIRLLADPREDCYTAIPPTLN